MENFGIYFLFIISNYIKLEAYSPCSTHVEPIPGFFAWLGPSDESPIYPSAFKGICASQATTPRFQDSLCL
jgi:hypothetical protein